MSLNFVLIGSPIFTLFSTGGTGNLLSIAAYQSMSLNQGCYFIESASFSNPSLLSGFWANSLLIKSRKLSGVFFGNRTMPALTISYSYVFVSA